MRWEFLGDWRWRCGVDRNSAPSASLDTLAPAIYQCSRVVVQEEEEEDNDDEDEDEDEDDDYGFL
eukprot:3647598-Pyramimonas_sp.AAC.1